MSTERGLTCRRRKVLTLNIADIEMPTDMMTREATPSADAMSEFCSCLMILSHSKVEN
jgi:hypothetical protein